MNIVYYSLLFVAGLALGSFANVLILRYDPDRNVFSGPSLSGRSGCMQCRRTLQWYELIPVFSFLVQRGKCRSCGIALTVQYPLVELAGGAITAAVPYFLNGFYGVASVNFFALLAPYWYYIVVAGWVAIFFILLLITVIDLRHYLIPNELNLLLGAIGAVNAGIMAFNPQGLLFQFRDSFLQQYVLLLSPFQNILANHALGAAAGFAFFLMLSLVTRGRGIGFGDVKLALAAGLALGWPDVGLTIMLSFVLGGIISVGLMLFNKSHMRDKVPFAPFFTLGFALTFFFGHALLSAYFGMFHL